MSSIHLTTILLNLEPALWVASFAVVHIVVHLKGH